MIKIIFLFCSVIYSITTNGQNVNNASPYKFSSDIFDDIQKDSNFYWGGGIASSDLSFIGLYRESLTEYDKPRNILKTISSTDSLDFLNHLYLLMLLK
jgi:hypothetical protein